MSASKLEIWVTAIGVRAPACNHAARNLKTVASSSGASGFDYETLDCLKCGVRKRYKTSPSGRRELLSSCAIRKVAFP